jgi:hypothetical protein
MALNTGIDPCSLLNNTKYPTLWVYGNFETEFPKIFQAGILKTYSDVLTSITSKVEPVLKDTQDNHRLVGFLKGKKLNDILISTPIVDSYIMTATGINKPSYTYSTNETQTTTTNQPQRITDIEIATLVNKLISDNLLLAQNELYNPAQFNGGQVTEGSDSLVYLYSLQENANRALTPTQLLRKERLESRNLKFFSNFLMEYCFYKTRYNILLTKYFTLYTEPSNTVTPTDKNIFGGGVPQPGTSTSGYSQQDYLKGLAYHMACLNTRMTDMRRVLSEITSRYDIIFQYIQAAINDGKVPGSNLELTTTIQALNASAKDVNTYMSEADFKKGVMDYNSEKNRYANIMLALYAFLNIAGIASIYHLASS